MTAVTEEKADKIVAACIALHNYSILHGDLKAYRETFELEDLDMSEGMNLYYQSEYVNDISGSRKYLFDYLNSSM